MKNFLYLLILTISILPTVAFAQQSLQNLALAIPAFLSAFLVPFLFGIAFLIFLYNAVRYFVLDSQNEQGREKAKYFALYGLFAFIFLLIFFGIVNLFVDSFGFGPNSALPPCPDYLVSQGGC